MTDPHQNPFGSNPFGGDPFGGAPFGQGGQAGPPVFGATPASPSPAGTAANTPATLSLVFAFVFAPVGAVLGHLGLSQIARTGQRGRDRALIGLTLSYAVIAATVVALVAWATLERNDTHPAVASPTPSAARPAATTTPPPSPTVAPADLAALVPTLADVQHVIGDDKLTLFHEAQQLEDDTQSATIDRPECLSVLESGAPQAYNMPAVTGVFGREIRDFTNMGDPIQSGNTVIALRDIPAARAQLETILSSWRQCANSTVVATFPGMQRITNRLTGLTDAGNEITVMPVELVGNGLTVVRLIAAKANVVVDSLLTYRTSRDEQQHALAMVNAILDKIPVPR